MADTRTIFISSFHILISRNIIASPVLDLLLGLGFRIVLLVPEEKRSFFEQQFLRVGVVIEGVARKPSRSDTFLRYLALASVRTQTLAIKRMTEMKGSGAWLSRIIGNNPLWRWFFRRIDSWLTPHDRFAPLFDQYQPLLVFSTDVQNENDVRLIHEARDRKIPVVGMVRSWDNLTAKGLIRALPDVLVVNNEIVKDEARRLHGVPEAMIRVVGIPHYDCYILPPPHSRDVFAKIGGLDSNKRWVVYAPTGDRYLGGANSIDREIIKFLNDEIPQTHQLLIRMPPSDSVNMDGIALSPSVVVMRPGVQLSSSANIFKNNELTINDDELLRSTIAYAGVVIAGPSTIVIDAAVYDRPIILIGFDGAENRPYYKSIRRYYDYDHFRPVMTSGGIRIATNFQELRDSLNDYMQNPHKDREGRREIISRECWKLDGQSSVRLLEVLTETANSHL